MSAQNFSLPLDISFTYSETDGNVMVGFAEEDSDLKAVGTSLMPLVFISITPIQKQDIIIHMVAQ